MVVTHSTFAASSISMSSAKRDDSLEPKISEPPSTRALCPCDHEPCRKWRESKVALTMVSFWLSMRIRTPSPESKTTKEPSGCNEIMLMKPVEDDSCLTR